MEKLIQAVAWLFGLAVKLPDMGTFMLAVVTTSVTRTCHSEPPTCYSDHSPTCHSEHSEESTCSNQRPSLCKSRQASLMPREILRCAQNDRSGNGQNDRSGVAQNDRSGVAQNDRLGVAQNDRLGVAQNDRLGVTEVVTETKAQELRNAPNTDGVFRREIANGAKMGTNGLPPPRRSSPP